MSLKWIFCLFLCISTAQADIFKPVYLQLTQIDNEHYDVLWKVPARDAQTSLKVYLKFPAGAQELQPRTRIYNAGAISQRWRMKIPEGLAEKPIIFDNLMATGADVIVHVEREDGSEQLERIIATDPQFLFTASPGSFELVSTYTWLGFEHILEGIDHLLFVLSLILIIVGKRRLLITITAFTIAHSITLTLATLDIIHIPIAPIEAMIALSIVFMALEIIHQQRGQKSLMASQPWIVAFIIGLLHGLGFASALAEIGLPEKAIPLALLFFNVGVELGQLIFIAGILIVILAMKKVFLPLIKERIAIFISAYIIGGISCYWFIERVANLVA